MGGCLGGRLGKVFFKANLSKESFTRSSGQSFFKENLSKESFTRLQALSLMCCKATISILICLCLLLVAQGVERNPGPVTGNISQEKIVSISTYNVQGLSIATHKGMQKFRKIINLCKNNTSNTNVICLQETHLIDLNYLKKVWQSEFVVSNGTRASRHKNYK
jgi:hypothetical protein